MSQRRAAIVLARLRVALPLAKPAAQTASAPPPPQVGMRYLYAGDTVRLAPCVDWSVLSVGPANEVEYGCQGWRMRSTWRDGMRLRGVYRPDGAAHLTFDPHFVAPEFPLEVGRRWSFRYEGFRGDLGASWSSEVECVVEAYEAGEHPLWRFVCDDSWRALLMVAGVHRSTFWYSPELGAVVRQEHRDDAAQSWRMQGW